MDFTQHFDIKIILNDKHLKNEVELESCVVEKEGERQVVLLDVFEIREMYGDIWIHLYNHDNRAKFAMSIDCIQLLPV